MKYVAPDYEKVSLNVAESFANMYGGGGCAIKETLTWQLVRPCEGTDDYQSVYMTFIEMGAGSNCYFGNTSA